MPIQLEQFLSFDNFHVAFKRLQTVNGYTLYKNLYRPDLKYFGYFLEENITLLIHQIKEEIYSPSKSLKLYIPKKNNLVRPLTVLDFQDLLVYQALVNVIGDVLFDEMSTYYNRSIFGNVYYKTDSEQKIYQFKKWKTQWKNYNRVTESIFNEGHEYFTDFDIASFFDTINHDILIKILEEKGVEPEITSILNKCLETWSIAANRNNYSLNQGLPQGPLASSLLADIYLVPIDQAVIRKSKLNVKYQRYVDDIRILSKTELEGKKAIAYLDLIARDFGLIPQSSKISTRKVENIKKELNVQHTRFSDIANEFKREGNKLKSATHNKQKKQFRNCFIVPSESKPNDDFLNKTIISFSLFKLNKDDEVRDSILLNISQLYPHFEGVLYYLSKHYANDSVVLNKLKELLKGDELLFQHAIALIYKSFPHLEYSEEYYIKHYENNKHFWLIKYFLLDWLRENNQFDLLNSIGKSQVYHINRKLLNFKYRLTANDQAKRKILRDGLKSQNNMEALQALYYYLNDYFQPIHHLESNNSFVKNIIENEQGNLINHVFLNSFKIEHTDKFFNEQIWSIEEDFQELKSSFMTFNKHRDLDPSVSLMSLNTFNEQVFNKIIKLKGITLGNGAEYGGSIPMLETFLPTAALFFNKVNIARNEKTYAHYKDREGKIRIRISFSELKKLLRDAMFNQAFEEICNYNF